MTFADFARGHGLVPPDYIEPGRDYRVPTLTHPRKRNGKLRLDRDGLGGVVANYENGEEAHQWKSGDAAIEIDHDKQNAELTARLAEKARKEREGIARANAIYKAGKPLLNASNPYLARKRIESMEGCLGLRVDTAGNLLVPMYSGARLVSVQTIAENGEKKFVTGAPAKLATWWIRRPRSTVTVLTEGAATGITIFQALTCCSVVVCFSASNLVAVAEHEDWSGLVAVASDNDWRWPCQWCKKNGEHLQNDPESPRPEQCRCNAGKTAAMKAAKAIGCGWAVPRGEGTDWNDAYVTALEEIESAHEFTRWKPSPHRMRSSALAPVAAAIFKAAKSAVDRTREK